MDVVSDFSKDVRNNTAAGSRCSIFECFKNLDEEGNE